MASSLSHPPEPLTADEVQLAVSPSWKENRKAHADDAVRLRQLARTVEGGRPRLLEAGAAAA